MTHEYAFDVNMWSTLRIKAEDEATARKKAIDALATVDFQFNGQCDEAITETAVYVEDGEMLLFEIDGTEVE